MKRHLTDIQKKMLEEHRKELYDQQPLSTKVKLPTFKDKRFKWYNGWEYERWAQIAFPMVNRVFARTVDVNFDV